MWRARDVVAVDGPAGSGKSTVSRMLAEQLGWAHLDTGAFYRAATIAALRARIDLNDHVAVSKAVSESTFDQIENRMLLDGDDVSNEIRTPELTRKVSAVAAIPDVRRVMVLEQRAWVARLQTGAVVEGRDIGSVVFPDAVLKVYLDADPLERARRRAGEDGLDASEVAKALADRDARDSTRETSPLGMASDAFLVDTTELSAREVVEILFEEVNSRLSLRTEDI